MYDLLFLPTRGQGAISAVLTFIRPLFDLGVGTFAGAYIAYQLSRKRDREAAVALQNREYLLPTVVQPVVEALRTERRDGYGMGFFDIERALETFEARYYLRKDLRKQLQEYVALVYTYRQDGAQLEAVMAARCGEMLGQREIPYSSQGTYFEMRIVDISWLEDDADIERLLPNTAGGQVKSYGVGGGRVPSQVFYIEPAVVEEYVEDLRAVVENLRVEFGRDLRWKRLVALRAKCQALNEKLENLLGRV